jgi:hypothetical protein
MEEATNEQDDEDLSDDEMQLLENLERNLNEEQ